MAQTIHTIYQAEGANLHMHLPKDLAGKRLEVIVRLAENEPKDKLLLQAASHVLAKDWQNEDDIWRDL